MKSTNSAVFYKPAFTWVEIKGERKLIILNSLNNQFVALHYGDFLLLFWHNSKY